MLERSDSRVAEKESSHGRSPWLDPRTRMSPVRGERIFRRYAADLASDTVTTAFSRGYVLSPLRG